jgi:hypothetical protein
MGYNNLSSQEEVQNTSSRKLPLTHREMCEAVGFWLLNMEVNLNFIIESVWTR